MHLSYLPSWPHGHCHQPCQPLPPPSLPGTISDDVIKAAFKKVAMQLHPDKNIDAAPALAARNRERFVRAQVAYDTLKDSERRRAYDRGQLTQ
jgi:DnaJ-class molecular chaperone